MILVNNGLIDFQLTVGYAERSKFDALPPFYTQKVRDLSKEMLKFHFVKNFLLFML